MNRPLLPLALPVVLLAAGAAPLAALTGVEVIERMERNERVATLRSTGSLQISDRFGTRTKSFVSTAAGDDRALLEFTNPEEAGQKILRLDDEIYLYFPEAEEVIHLQGAALRENVLGSDFSYEDMTGAGSLLDDYEVLLEGREPVAGRDCYRLRLTARRRDVVYPQQVVWIDAEQFVTRRVEQFTRRGRPLKQLVISDYREVGGKLIPVRLEMSDLMKQDSRTLFLIDTVEVDGAIDESVFSLEELTF